MRRPRRARSPSGRAWQRPPACRLVARSASSGSRSVANAQYQQNASEDSYVDNLLLSLIGLLVGVALVNTLVVATLQHREELAILRRMGATTRQLLATMTCQAAAVTVIGVVLGVAAQLATVASVAAMLTGAPVPSIPWLPATVILGLVALLTGLSVLAPTTRLVPSA